jgi:chemotaxis protein MotB
VKLPNKIVIEGHTDSTPYGRPDYSNWELSADRANAARRILSESGLDASRISQVRGFADQRLLLKDDPTNPSNRRISIIVRNQGLDEQDEKLAAAPAAAPAKPATPEKTAAVMLPTSVAKK